MLFRPFFNCIVLICSQNTKHVIKHSEELLPLASSKLGNTQPQPGERAASGFKVSHLTLDDSDDVLRMVEAKA